MTPLRDLEVRKDVKAGSPRTPSGGIPVREVQEYAVATNGSGIWRAIATGLGGLVIGLLLAWFTALQNKGISQKEMQEYVQERERLPSEHNQNQDRDIGIVIGKQDKLFERMQGLETVQKDEDRDLQDCRSKMKLAADYIEEQRKLKR